MPRCGANFRKSVENISDRAKRYRAHSPGCRPKGPKVCFKCGSRRFVVPDHIDGDESNGRASNLRWACKRHNTILGKRIAKQGRGVRTRQYNPNERDKFEMERKAAEAIRRGRTMGQFLRELKGSAKMSRAELQAYAKAYHRVRTPGTKNPGAKTLGAYVDAAVNHTRGSHDAGGRVIHETPKAKRREFAREIWFRRGYSGNPPADIMPEFWAGKLKDSHGKTVTSIEEARAILLSELRAMGRIPPRKKNPERPAAQKLSHAAVKYESPSRHANQSCASCIHFIAANPPRCEAVQSPISPEDWCKRFEQIGKAADDFYRKFHGRGPANIYNTMVKGMDPYGNHRELTSLGPLVRLVVGVNLEIGDDGAVLDEGDIGATEINFVPMNEYRRATESIDPKNSDEVRELKAWLKKTGAPDVAGVPPDGRQLYFVGGKQELDAGMLKTLGCDPAKDLCDLGDCFLIEYFAQKRFDKFEPMTYYHHFGEVTGVQPRLIYRRPQKMLELVGGEYVVKASGIDN